MDRYSNIKLKWQKLGSFFLACNKIDVDMKWTMDFKIELYIGDLAAVY